MGWKDKARGFVQHGMDKAKDAAQEAIEQRRTGVDDAEVQDRGRARVGRVT